MISKIQNIFYCLICMIVLSSIFSCKERPKKITLSNGLKVYLLYDAHLPYLKLELLTPLGSIKDPDSKKGLSYILAQSLSRGTAVRSSLDISKEFEQLGSQFSAITRSDYSVFSAETLSWNTSALLEVFSDVITRPYFDSKEVEFVKNQTLSRIKKQPESSSSFANNIIKRLLFENSPYGHSVFGHQKSIKDIQSSDVKAHYKEYFQPQESVLAITGQYPKDMKKKLEKFLGHWNSTSKNSICCFFTRWFKKKPPVIVPSSTWPQERPIKYIIVHRDQQMQSDIRVGFTSISRSSKDFLAFQIANIVLGGGMFSSRLVDEIRENLGYTYTIRSTLNSFRQAGLFNIATPTRLDVTRKALDKIQELLKEFHAKGITEEEMKNAKEYYRVSLMKVLETPESRLSRRMLLEYMGGSYDFEKNLKKISLDQIQEVIHKYFVPLTVVILSDHKKIESQFKDIERKVTVVPFDQFL